MKWISKDSYNFGYIKLDRKEENENEKVFSEFYLKMLGVLLVVTIVAAMAIEATETKDTGLLKDFDHIEIEGTMTIHYNNGQTKTFSNENIDTYGKPYKDTKNKGE